MLHFNQRRHILSKNDCLKWGHGHSSFTVWKTKGISFFFHGPGIFFFFLYKRENLTKWKHKQLIVWNLTLISISLYFFSVSFSLPHCEKLPSVINWKLELIILLSSLGEKVMDSAPPPLHGHAAGQGGDRAARWLQRVGGRTQWGQLQSSHRILILGNNDLGAAQAPDSPGAQQRETGYRLEEKEEEKASGQMFLDNTSCGPAPRATGLKQLRRGGGSSGKGMRVCRKPQRMLVKKHRLCYILWGCVWGGVRACAHSVVSDSLWPHGP